MSDIRPAVEADRQDWMLMRAQLWPDASATEHRAEIDATLARDDLICLIARQAERALGFAEASIRHDPVNGCDTSPVGFLEGLYVSPGCRRSGVAMAMVTAVECWAASRGCTELGSDSEVGNTDGHAFHIGAGFEEREQVIFYRKTIGAVVDALGLEPRTR